MGHYGKHVIDPETGLCEICDRNAIREVRQGRRLGEQVNKSLSNIFLSLLNIFIGSICKRKKCWVNRELYS